MYCNLKKKKRQRSILSKTTMNSCSTTVLLTFTVLRLQLLDNWIEHTNDMVRNLAFVYFFLFPLLLCLKKRLQWICLWIHYIMHCCSETSCFMLHLPGKIKHQVSSWAITSLLYNGKHSFTITTNLLCSNPNPSKIIIYLYAAFIFFVGDTLFHVYCIANLVGINNMHS